MNVKLLMQISKRQSDPLYMIFLDIKKAYDTLDRDRTMQLLKEYVVGERVTRIINRIWKDDTMIPKQNSYFGTSFEQNVELEKVILSLQQFLTLLLMR